MLSQQGSAALVTRPWFRVEFAGAQYSGFYVPALYLARLVGPDAAIRILLTVSALLLPLAAWMLLRSFGRDPRLAVFAPLLFHTAPLYIGVYNFVAAVPIAVMAIALVERQIHAPSWWRGASIAALCVALLYLHPSGLVIAVGAAVVLAMTAEDRRLKRALAPLVPALTLLALWIVRPPPATPAAAAALPTKVFWQAPIEQVRDLLRFANVIDGRWDEIYVAVLALIWIALVRAKGARTLPRRAWRLPLLAGGLFAAYLFAPKDIGYIAFIHLRAVPFLALFAICSPAIARTRRTSALFAAIAAVHVAYGAKLATTYRAFDREVQPRELEQVLSSIEPGRRVISLMLDRKSKLVHFEPYMHFGMYYQVERGGRVRFNFGELPWMPVRFREPPQRLPLGWEFRPGLFEWRTAQQDADYVFVRTPDPYGDAAEPPEPTTEFADGWELRARHGRWEVFEPIQQTTHASRP
jgi:hypothetical protein